MAAMCHFCARADFRNGQAVRAHLRACKAYRDRHLTEQLYRIVRSLQSRPRGTPAVEARRRAEFDADQARQAGRPPRRALCHFCGRADFKNRQAVRAHLRACQAYRDRRAAPPGASEKIPPP
jgi:hypothetical protein